MHKSLIISNGRYIFLYTNVLFDLFTFFYNNADCAISSKSKIKLKRYVQSMQHLFSYFKALKVYKRLLLLFIEDTPESYQSTPGLFVHPMRRSNKFVYSF